MTFERNPVILHGAGRSGTTLTLGILRANRRFYIPDELNFLLPRLVKTIWEDTKFLPFWLGQNRCLNETMASDWIDVLSKSLMDDSPSSELNKILLVNNKHKDDEPLLLRFIQAEKARVNQIIGDFIINLLISDRKKYSAWGFKEIWNGVPTSDDWPWEIYLKVFERPKWVHLVRNPIDWLHSLAGNIEVEKPDLDFIKRNLNYWVQINRRSLEIDERMSFRIRYEDLITTPVSKVRALCDFAGITYSDEMLMPFKHRFVQNKINADFSCYSEMNFSDIEGFEDLCKKFGYEDLPTLGPQ